MTRVALLVLVLCWIGGGIANADTLTLDSYRARLREARSLVLAAKNAPAAQRSALLAQVGTLLRGTDQVTLRDGSTLSIDDSALASRLAGADDASLTRALADLDARIGFADAAAITRLTGPAVDDRLRSVARPAPAKAQPGEGLPGRVRFLSRSSRSRSNRSRSSRAASSLAAARSWS